jgi:hypothetical protein
MHTQSQVISRAVTWNETEYSNQSENNMQQS